MQNQKCPKCGGEMDAGKVQADSLMYYSDWQKKTFKLGILVDKACACLTCGYIEMYLNPEVLRKKIQDNNPNGIK
ncbi:PF20097 family protein [Leptolyngbya ohadii]|uniref:PF20097 family protein n=1 Tax=Leptolyngbya ohadii TaxID=1962290 RepID=UPI00117B0C52|nr:PF20097 family protein [Leptolyngbya ohadii]